MTRLFHGVVQYPPDHEQGGLEAVNQEVARPADYLRTCTHMIAAQSQVPRSNTRAEFGPHDTARPVRLCRHVAKRRDDQALIAQPGGLAELLMRPGKDVDDICLGGVRQAKSEASARRLGQLGGTATQLADKVLKPIIGNVGVAPRQAKALPAGATACLRCWKRWWPWAGRASALTVAGRMSADSNRRRPR